MMKFPLDGKIDFMFQTTNQYIHMSYVTSVPLFFPHARRASAFTNKLFRMASLNAAALALHKICQLPKAWRLERRSPPFSRDLWSYWCIYLSIYLSMYLSIYLSMYLSIYLSIYSTYLPYIYIYIYDHTHII